MPRIELNLLRSRVHAYVRQLRDAGMAEPSLADAVRRGWLTPPGRSVLPAAPAGVAGSLSDLLSELREDRDGR